MIVASGQLNHSLPCMPVTWSAASCSCTYLPLEVSSLREACVHDNAEALAGLQLRDRASTQAVRLILKGPSNEYS